MNPYLIIIIATFFAALSSVLVRFVKYTDIYYISLFTLFFASAILFIISALKKEKLLIKKDAYLFLLGLSQAFTWFFLFWSILLNPISVSMLVFYTSPAIVLILSPFLLGEKLEKIGIIAIIFAFLGLFLILNPFAKIDFSIIGLIFSVVASFSYALNIISARKLKEKSPLSLSFFSHFLGFVILLALLPFFKNNSIYIPDLEILSIIGICSGISYFFLYSGLKFLIAQKASILMLFEPVFAIILGIFLFSEIPGISIIFGGICILFSAYLASKIG